MERKHSADVALKLGIPPGTTTFRTTLSLPADLAVGLNHLAKQLGISQSSLVTVLLSQALPDIQGLIDKLPPPDDPDAVKRFRGQSIDAIMEAVSSAVKQM